MNPLISIIIVTYNSGPILKDCLISINRISGVDIEVIIVDNHPEAPDTSLFSHEFPFVKFIGNPSNSGFGGGNNIGASAAKGRILFFLNPDTTIESFNPSSLISLFEATPNAIVGFPLHYPDEQYCKPVKFIPEIDFILPKRLYAGIYRHLMNRDGRIPGTMYISGASFCISKTLFLEVGGFDESYFLFYEENDLRMRLKKIGKYYPYLLSNGFKIYHHEGKSYSTNAIQWSVESLKIYSQKYNKRYLRGYKRLAVAISMTIRRIFGRDTHTHKILYEKLAP